LTVKTSSTVILRCFCLGAGLGATPAEAAAGSLLSIKAGHASFQAANAVYPSLPVLRIHTCMYEQQGCSAGDRKKMINGRGVDLIVGNVFTPSGRQLLACIDCSTLCTCTTTTKIRIQQLNPAPQVLTLAEPSIEPEANMLPA
jgi:hypothetical protein